MRVVLDPLDDLTNLINVLICLLFVVFFQKHFDATTAALTTAARLQLPRKADHESHDVDAKATDLDVDPGSPKGKSHL